VGEQHVRDAGEQDEAGVHGRPRPGGDPRPIGVLEHLRRPGELSAHDPVVHEDVDDRQGVDPAILVEGEQGDGDEEVEVRFDQPAGEVHEQGRAAEERGRGQHRPCAPRPQLRGTQYDGEDDRELLSRVPGRVAEGGRDGEQRRDVQEEDPQHPGVPRLPQLVGKVSGIPARAAREALQAPPCWKGADHTGAIGRAAGRLYEFGPSGSDGVTTQTPGEDVEASVRGRRLSWRR
jgi:hypothetical protein